MIDPRVRRFRSESYLLGYYECHDGHNEDHEQRVNTLAADLSRQLLPDDAVERIADWLSRNDKHAFRPTYLRMATELLAALTAPEPTPHD
jgi:hypothetical protein